MYMSYMFNNIIISLIQIFINFRNNCHYAARHKSEIITINKLHSVVRRDFSFQEILCYGRPME